MDSVTPNRDAAYTMPPRPKGRWWRRVWVGLLLLVLAAVGLHAGRGVHARSKLGAELDAYRRAGEPILPADFAPAVVPDQLNAAVALREAAQSIDGTTEAWKRYEELCDKVEVRLTLSGEELAIYAAVLRENAAAFDGIRRAVGRPQVEWGEQVGQSPDMFADLKFLSEQRQLGRLVAAAALHAHEIGDDAEALARTTDLLFISRAVDQHPTLMPHLVSIGIAALGCEVLAQIAQELVVVGGEDAGTPTLPQRSDRAGPQPRRPAARGLIEALIRELLNEGPLVAGRQRMLLGERMMMVEAATAIADGRLALTDLGSEPPAADGPSPGDVVLSYVVRPMALVDARIMARYATDVRAALASPDFPSYRTRVPPTTKAQLTSPLALHVVASVFLSNFDVAAQNDYKNLANRRMAAVALACRLYALDHDGKLPSALADLVPAYLPVVPTDPLTAGRPLGYVPDPDRPVVYNVGENLTDDGGYEPLPTARRKEWQERSDDVRHLKRQPRRPTEPDEVDPVQPHGPERPDGLP